MNLSAIPASLLLDSSQNNLQMFRDFMKLSSLRNGAQTNCLQKQIHLKTEGQICCIISEHIFGWLNLRRLSTKTPQDDEINHYNTLGVTPNCSKSKVKVAYYKLSKKYHPDVNKTEEAKVKFQEISDAYDVLSNNIARQQYDRKRATFSPEYRSNARHGQSRFKPKKIIYPMGKSSEYNFDEWHERHYSSTLQQQLELKIRQQRTAKQLNDLNQDKEDLKAGDLSSFFPFLIAVLCSVGAVFIYFEMKMAKNRQKRKDKDRQS